MPPIAPQEGDSLFHTLLETAPIAVVIVNEQGQITLINRKAEEMFGYEREGLYGQPLEVLLPERFRQAHVRYRSAFAQAPRVRPMGVDLELYARRSDGTEFPVEIGLSHAQTSGGLLMTAYITDVSERKRAQSALQRYAQRLEGMLEIDRAILAAQSARAIAEVALHHLTRLVDCEQASVLLFEGEGAVMLTTEGAWGPSHTTHQQVAQVAPATAQQLDVPLVAGTVQVGLLRLTAPDASLAPGQQEIVREVATQLAVALQQARLREDLAHYATVLEQRVDERTREIERRREVAEGLRDILASLNSNRPLDGILDDIVTLAGRLLGTDASALYRLARDEGRLHVAAARGLPAAYVEQVTLAVGQGAVGRAVREQRPVAVRDVTTLVPDEGDPLSDPRQRHLLAELATRYRSMLAVPLVVKGESYGSLAVYYDAPRDFSEEEIGLVVAFADQAALAIENARLQTQVEESAVAAERNRLARDLHDAVTQTLFSASLIAEILPRLWVRDEGLARQRLEDLRQLTRGALAEMRMLLFELRPNVLIRTRLGELLAQLGDAVTGRARVPVAVIVEGEQPLPPDAQVALYRIAQEALNNVAKHASAGAASVHLAFDPQDGATQVTLRVRDDGRGFDPACVAPERLGLDIMRERAAAIGADLAIHSTPGEGSEVEVRWRYNNPNDGGEEGADE